MASLKKSFIMAFGIEEPIALQICEKHNEVLEEIKTERDELKNKLEKNADIQKQLDKANEKIKELEESNDTEALQEKVKKLEKERDKAKTDLEEYKKDISQKEEKTKKSEAYKALLKDIGVSEKRIDTVLKVSNFDDIKLDKDGKIEDSDKLSESLKTEWADFIVKTEQRGAQVSNPPSNKGGADTGASRASSLAQSFYANRYGTAKEE